MNYFQFPQDPERIVRSCPHPLLIVMRLEAKLELFRDLWRIYHAHTEDADLSRIGKANVEYSASWINRDITTWRRAWRDLQETR